MLTIQLQMRLTWLALLLDPAYGAQAVLQASCLTRPSSAVHLLTWQRRLSSKKQAKEAMARRNKCSDVEDLVSVLCLRQPCHCRQKFEQLSQATPLL